MPASLAKIISGMLIFLLFCQSCTITRPIFAYDNPARIPTKLSDKDIGRTVKVFLADGQVESGKLMAYDTTHMVICRSKSDHRVVIPYQGIRKIEIKRRNYAWLLAGMCVLLFKVLEASVPPVGFGA